MRGGRIRCTLTTMSARFVTIRHVADPLEAEMLRDLLEGEGIPATIQGNNHSALLGGMLAPALNVPLQVPEDEAERARAILSALTDFEPHDSALDPPSAPDAEEMTDGDGPYRASSLDAGAPPRSKNVAIAAAIVLPMILGLFGAGHFYARSYLRGVAILALAWTGIVLAISGQPAGLAAAPAAILLDALGAVAVIRAAAR